MFTSPIIIPSTTVTTLTPSQVNTSSIGDTYTDVSGNTFSETAHQTRLTMASYPRFVGGLTSGHVSSGTGTFELFNFTDSTSLATSTTTSTTEVRIGSYTSASVSTNVNDQITIRVKNSVAGATTTIDYGGMFESDTSITTGASAVGYFPIVASASAGGRFETLSIASVKYTSTSTATIQLLNGLISNTSLQPGNAIGNSFGTTQGTSIITITPSTKIYAVGSSQILAYISSITSFWGLGLSVGIKCDLI